MGKSIDEFKEEVEESIRVREYSWRGGFEYKEVYSKRIRYDSEKTTYEILLQSPYNPKEFLIVEDYQSSFYDTAPYGLPLPLVFKTKPVEVIKIKQVRDLDA